MCLSEMIPLKSGNAMVDDHLNELRHFLSRQVTRVGDVGLHRGAKDERDAFRRTAVADARHNDISEGGRDACRPAVTDRE